MPSEESRGRTSRTIEVSEKTKERYDRKKAEMDAADPNLPDMTDDQFMKCLLDTVKAVDEGFYTRNPDHEIGVGKAKKSIEQAIEYHQEKNDE